jgi:nucleoid DNA-binding protein
MTRAEMYDVIAREAGIQKKEARFIWEYIIVNVKLRLKKFDEVTLPGIGRIKKVRIRGHNGLHPKTKKPVTIPDHTILRLKADKSFMRGM